jgi:enoyl-CoA hydratase/carnithine racemase
MTDAVLQSRVGQVVVLTLNDPDKRNALSTRLTDALADALLGLERDGDCRAVVLTGGRHFCSGGSLDGLNTNGLFMRADMRRGHRVIRTIMSGRLPVVAAVEGAAFGAGLALAAACDHVVADPKAKFGAVWGKVGIMPDWGALQTLPLRMGMARARRFMLFSEVLDAPAAVANGLADELATDGQALTIALERAASLAEAAPGAVSAIKTGLARFPQPLETLLDWEADTQALLIASPDFAEGRNAFFEKRAPLFTGE